MRHEKETSRYQILRRGGSSFACISSVLAKLPGRYSQNRFILAIRWSRFTLRPRSSVMLAWYSRCSLKLKISTPTSLIHSATKSGSPGGNIPLVRPTPDGSIQSSVALSSLMTDGSKEAKPFNGPYAFPLLYRAPPALSEKQKFLSSSRAKVR